MLAGRVWLPVGSYQRVEKRQNRNCNLVILDSNWQELDDNCAHCCHWPSTNTTFAANAVTWIPAQVSKDGSRWSCITFRKYYHCEYNELNWNHEMCNYNFMLFVCLLKGASRWALAYNAIRKQMRYKIGGTVLVQNTFWMVAAKFQAWQR